jgi:hypothetical protein
VVAILTVLVKICWPCAICSAYLVANKLLAARRIGTRVLIPVADLRRFSRGDHPARLAG